MNLIFYLNKGIKQHQHDISQRKPLQIPPRRFHRLVHFLGIGPVPDAGGALAARFAADDLGDGIRPVGGGGALLACSLGGKMRRQSNGLFRSRPRGEKGDEGKSNSEIHTSGT